MLSVHGNALQATVAELEAMRDEAAAAGAKIWMGYNKNVARCVVASLAVTPDTPPLTATPEPNQNAARCVVAWGACLHVVQIWFRYGSDMVVAWGACLRRLPGKSRATGRGVAATGLRLRRSGTVT